jgi:hypothetical protein
MGGDPRLGLVGVFILIGLACYGMGAKFRWAGTIFILAGIGLLVAVVLTAQNHAK